MADPLMDGWPSPNSGWPELNTTRLVPNALKVTSDGSVVIIGQGRRTMTTANAFQKMPKPGKGGTSRWNHFVRQYDRYFKRPFYSSLVAGTWDTINTQPGLEARLRGVFKMTDGLLVVGQHNGQGNPLPVLNVPAWGKDDYDAEEAFIGILKDDLITNPQDDPVVSTTSNEDAQLGIVMIKPNPTSDLISWATEPMAREVIVVDVNGQIIMRSMERSLDMGSLVSGMYVLQFIGADGLIANKVIVKN